MKSTKKAPYEAPRLGDLELFLDRTLLAGSELETPASTYSNEGVVWGGDYVID